MCELVYRECGARHTIKKQISQTSKYSESESEYQNMQVREQLLMDVARRGSQKNPEPTSYQCRGQYALISSRSDAASVVFVVAKFARSKLSTSFASMLM